MSRSSKKKALRREVASNAVTTGPASRGVPSWLGSEWLWGSVLVLAVILVYQPVWYAGFIWDDDLLLTANPCIVGPLGLKEIWTTSAADICPLTITTLWFEHALWGLAPLPYHLVNVFLHGACAVLLWWVLRGLQVPGAWLGAALWALHPVVVESVAWVAEMKNTQSGLFYLLTIFFFVKGLRDRGGGSWNYALTLLFAALAMASKSSTVILPLVLCLCAWWVEGRWQWRKSIKLGPIFLMSLATGTLSMVTQEGHGSPDRLRTWPERLATAGDAVWFYLGKLLWPHPLITVYPRWKIDAGWWISYWPLLAVLAVLVVLWLKRGSWSRPWFFAFAYFLVALFPALGLIDNTIFRDSFVFDHLQYLASMGPLALAGAGLVHFLPLAFPGKQWLPFTLGAGLLLVLGAMSWQRTWVYLNQETLWTDALAKNPNIALGHNNLGNVLRKRGQVDQAIAEYQKALEIDPNYDQAHNDLGNALSQKGQNAEAIAEYQAALKINPNEVEPHNNLGEALFRMGRVDEAIAEYQRAMEINPNLAETRLNLGNALLQKGEVDEAVALYEQALAINPNLTEVLTGLGNALLQKGQVDQAIEQYQRALQIDPNFAKAHINLGSAFLRKGQLDDALAHFQSAVKIDPNFAAAHYDLGIVLLQKGQVNDAIDQFQQAVQLNPDFTEAQNYLAKAQEMARQAPGSK
jgi:tetratricopeptide (TPR) repeat protein